MRLHVEPLWVLCAVLTSVAGGRAGAQAADPATLAQQRHQIEAETRRLDAVFAAEQAACANRFAVTDCSEEVRLRRRETLAPLRARWLALDDVERRERAAARLQAIDDKRRTQRSSVPDAPPPRAVAERPPLVASAPLIVVRRDDAASRQQAVDEAAAQRVAASKRRRQQHDDDAARVRERLAERESSGKKAAPLPVPR